MASSSDISTLNSWKINDYASLAIITTVAYDYFLTFSKEVEYIWSRPFSWISAMFILVRYGGFIFVLNFAILGSTFVPGPIPTCTAIYQMITWSYPILTCTADLVMILRVYALWQQSRRILWVLLAVYIPMVVINVIDTVLYSIPGDFGMTVPQVLGISICLSQYKVSSGNILAAITAIVLFVLGIMMFVLVITQFAIQLWQMYRVTKQWQLNRYLKLLVREGTLYFLVKLLVDLFTILSLLGRDSTYGVLSTVGFLAAYVGLVTMISRFILSVRELASRDHVQYGSGVDSAFGISRTDASVGQISRPIMFADAPEGLQVDGDIEMMARNESSDEEKMTGTRTVTQSPRD